MQAPPQPEGHLSKSRLVNKPRMPMTWLAPSSKADLLRVSIKIDWICKWRCKRISSEIKRRDASQTPAYAYSFLDAEDLISRQDYPGHLALRPVNSPSMVGLITLSELIKAGGELNPNENPQV